MHKVIVAGSGKIGSLIALLLIESGDYEVFVIDKSLAGVDCKRLGEHPHLHKKEIDVQNETAMNTFLSEHQFHGIISSLPFFCNLDIAKLARAHSLHYFDLTEDIAVTEQVKKLAEGSDKAFVPQCGLAPGFISIVTNHLMQKFESLRVAKMRVGALPRNSSNALQYSLTWSTDGLINEYGNPCLCIQNGEEEFLQPLEGLEYIQINGMSYEAFNTSGGLGSLPELYSGKIKSMNYKTIRYPGHCSKMRFLMKGLRLNYDRSTLKHILENALPKTYQDVVIIYAAVMGIKNNELIEKSYMNKVYPKRINNYDWSAIQVTTAAGISTVVDLVLNTPEDYQGYIYQEKISLDHFLANRFGHYYSISGEE